MTLRRTLGAWTAICVAMVTNGIVRETALVPLLKRTAADIVSAALGVTIILGVTRFFLRPFAGREDARPSRVAAAWLSVTIAFEFLFGHYMDGKSWGELAGNYAIWRGRLWPVVLATAVLAPFIWTRWTGRSRPAAPDEAVPSATAEPATVAVGAAERDAA